MNISFKLLLHAQSFSFTLGFSLQGNLHAINGLLEVFAGSKELFLLLSNAAFNLLSYLSKFKLGSENLVFLLLKSTFSLFKSSLKFHFLCLKSLPDFVNLMDGSTTFADLIHDVLDLVAQDLILLSDIIQLKDRFFIGTLNPEEL